MTDDAQRSVVDLVTQLREQVGFLLTSARHYDDGEYHEAKRLAATARVLCHHTTRSHSLLAQVELVDRIRFVDTNTMSALNASLDESPRDPDLEYITVFESGLAPAAGYPTGLVAPLDRARRNTPKEFRDWWSDAVLRDTPDSTLTRSEIVLMLANKDGGAHVDPILDARYNALSRDNALGTFAYRTADGIETVIDTNPSLPIMRQIAFELIETLGPIAGIPDTR